MKSMKRNFWKKTAAGIMAVMILSGGVPILDMPSMSMFDMTASAASTQYISLDTTARYKVTVEWNVENDNDNGDNYFELTYRNYTDRSLELNEMNNVYGYAASVIQSNAAQKTGSQSATFILPSPPTAIRYSCYGKTADKSEWYINRIKVEVVNDYYAADSGKPRSIDLWKGSFGMNMSHVGGRSNAATLSFSGSEPTFSKWDNDNGSDKTQFTLNYFKDGFFPSINGVEEIFGSNTINFSGFSSQADGVTYSYYPGCPYDQFGAKWPTGKAFLTSFSSRGGWSYNEMFQAGHLVLRDTNYSYTPYTITITFRYNNNLSKSKTVNIIPPYYNLTVGNSSHGTLTVNPTGSVAARTPVQVTAKATDIGYIPYRMEYNATPTSCSFWYFNKHENGVWQGTNNMPNYDVNNLYATFKDVWGVGQGANGSKDHPYLISSTEGWDLLCDSLEDADLYNGVKGKYFQLTKDITVNRMVGSDSHPFEGTFDGNGKTLTFSCTPTDNYAAPFRKLKGTESAHAKISNLTVKTTITAKDYRHIAGLVALHEGYLDITNCNANVTLKASVGNNNPADLYPAGLVSQSNGNLTISGCKVTGNIETNGKYAGGFVGIAQDAMTIENSMSSVTINSTVSGDGTHGGFVGVVQTKSVLTINGCVFNGRLLGADTNSCGGFIGWRNSGAEICNSLFAPAEVTVKKDGSATFSRNTVDTYNCYYTYLFNDGTNHVSGSANDATKPDRWYNGKQAHTVTAGENVTINYGTAKNTYSVSGITAYDTGLLYGGKLYAGKNEQVYLTLSYTGTSPAGYNPSGYSVSLSNGKMTMPDNDVIVNAVYKANTYSVVFNKNASDATGTMAAQSFTYDAEKALTANAFKRTGWTFAGWATSANGDVVYTDKQAVKNLTVENGKTVTLYAKWTQNDYTISKSAEHGSIKVKVNNAETNTAHYSDTVKVEVTPDTGYYVKSVKYNNKSVTLQNNAGSFTMPAENVTVNAEMAKRNYDVSYDSGIQHGTVTADKTNADYGEKVSVTVEPDTGYSIKNVTMNGTVLTPVNGTYEFNMPAGEAVLKAEFTANDYTISLKPNVQNGTLTADKLTAKYGEEVTLTLTPDNNYILKYVVVVGEKGADLTKVDDTHYTFNMPAEDVTVNCEYITFTKVEAVAPTCTEDGHIAYYLGSDGLFYADTNGTLVEDINNDRIINQADIVVKATGHSYVVDSSEWAEVNDHYYVTVYAKCSVCGKVDSIGYANVSYDDYEITKEATADETGVKTYTATVDYMGEKFTVTKNVEIPKIQAVASVNGTAYDSLKDAIKAADDGDVVILGDDVNESDFYLDCYKSVTLDLNHHTVVLGTLGVEDNLTIKNGTLTCYISNSNTGNDNTLTLDAATINAPNGLQWLATHIAVTNGSKLNLSENVYCGGGSEDGFSLTIDDTSSVVLNNTVPSGYNEELVRSEFGKYLPDGYSFVYNETKYEYEIVDANGKVVTEAVTLTLGVLPSKQISYITANGQASEEVSAVIIDENSVLNQYFMSQPVYYVTGDVNLDQLFLLNPNGVTLILADDANLNCDVIYVATDDEEEAINLTITKPVNTDGTGMVTSGFIMCGNYAQYAGQLSGLVCAIGDNGIIGESHEGTITLDFADENAKANLLTYVEDGDMFACGSVVIPAEKALTDGETTYTGTLTADALKAISEKTLKLDMKPVIINTVDINGISTSQNVYANTFTSADYSVPSAYLDGYTLTGWKVNGESYTSASEANAAVETLVKAKTNVTVEAIYEKVNAFYTVTVSGGKMSTGKTSGTVQVSKLVTVKAGTVAGKTFSHWERNGVKVSSNSIYSFYMPNEDVELTAVFTDAAVEPAGTAIIESVKTTSNKLSFVSVLNVPKNCKFVKGGLVATNNASIGENVDANTATYVKLSTKATANSKNVKYTWTKSGVGSSTWYVKAYLVYKDASGAEHTVYSDAVKADAVREC